MEAALVTLHGAGLQRVAGFSYGAATLAFVVLAGLLATRWRGRRNALLFCLACSVSAAWALATALLALRGQAWAVQGDLLETLRSGVWLTLLLLLAEPAGLRRRAWLVAIGAIATGQLVLCTLALLAPQLGGAAWLPALPQWQLALLVARLLSAVLGMTLVEQLYRTTPLQQRWAVKFACLGIAALFLYDFYLYSDSLLLRRIQGDIWAARGFVNALCAPLLALAVARNAAWTLGLAVSRYVVLRSAALLGAALYLLLMAGGGYLIRYLGGAWGPVMQLACLCGALILLAGMLFSGALRARLKVLINKHFYRARYDYRQEWLSFTRALSAPGPGLGERTIQALAQLVESPAGALWIRREHDVCEPAASWNWAPQSASEAATGGFCQFMETRQWILDVPQLRQQRSGPVEVPLAAWLATLPQLWLIVPLLLHGRLFGFVALAQPRIRISLNWEARDLLKIAGSQAAGYLAYRESADSLLQARQFDAFNRMSTFIVHDLKNLVFQLSLLLSNADKHKANPAFQQDMLATLAHSVRKMELLLQKLSPGAAPEHPAPLLIEQVLQRVVAARADAEPAPQLLLQERGLTVLAHAARLERVLGHLLQNAIDATARDGNVVVRLLREQQSAVVELQDSGAGMSGQFIRERLFKPFESTKLAGMGVGAFESREYIREVGGQLEVASVPSHGTTFRVILPLYSTAVAA